jgi:transposase
MDKVVQTALRLRIVKPQVSLAAADSTGLETERASHYFAHRSNKKRSHWLKIALTCDTKSGFYLSVDISKGPSNDMGIAKTLLSGAYKRVPFKRVLMDMGFDSGPVHAFVNEELGARCIIPVRRLTNRAPKNRYRWMMRYHFRKKTYGQRWQIESAISRDKRRFGCALRARVWEAQVAEAYIWALIHNIGIVLFFPALRPPLRLAA